MKTLRTTIVLAALAIGTACATAGSGDGTGEEAPETVTAVEVINEVQPPTPVSVYLEEQFGSRALLGTVEPLSTRTLRIRSVRTDATYHLEARTGGGRTILSGDFNLNPGETVTWNLGTNVIAP